MSQRKARSEERAFVAEGPVLLAEAVRSSAPIEELYVDLDFDLDAELVAALPVPVRWVTPGVLSSILDAASPQPVATVIAMQSHDLADVPSSEPLLVLHDLRDPGNVGTLLRTAEASGFGGVVLTGSSVDVTNPKTVRASAGSMFRIPVVAIDDGIRAFDQLRASGRTVAVTVVRNGTSHEASDLRGAAIVLGNEAHGIPQELIDAADLEITIPLAGPTESLNVAAAGAVLCFESWRQRRSDAASSAPPTINSFDKNDDSTESCSS